MKQFAVQLAPGVVATVRNCDPPADAQQPPTPAVSLCPDGRPNEYEPVYRDAKRRRCRSAVWAWIGGEHVEYPFGVPQAAVLMGVTEMAIRNAIRCGHQCCGRGWTYADGRRQVRPTPRRKSPPYVDCWSGRVNTPVATTAD